MIDDFDRRVVAARLRALDVPVWYNSTDEVDSLETAIGCSIGQDWQDQDWWHRLADLIDRPTCHNLATKPADEFLCSECGEHVDIAYIETTDDYHAQFCPKCGAEVVE